MKKYSCGLLLALLTFCCSPAAVDGFAAGPRNENKLAATTTKSGDSIIGRAEQQTEAQVGRRRLLAMVGAASLLALLYEDADAAIADTQISLQEEPMKSTTKVDELSSLMLAIETDSQPAAPRPTIDTRAILGKASKKALGGGKGKCYSLLKLGTILSHSYLTLSSSYNYCSRGSSRCGPSFLTHVVED